MDGTLAGLLIVLGVASLLAFGAARARDEHGVPTLESWALADRRYGAFSLWLLLGGTVYTAYTFAAVPGLVFGAGAIGFFALPYTVIVWPLAFWMLPRLWAVCDEHGFVTVADYARGRWGSHQLGLVIALTGVLATMPYVALQLFGIRVVLEVAGVYPDGVAGDLVLTLVFAVLALATYRSGLRAPALISVVKGALVVGFIVGVGVAALDRVGGLGGVFALPPAAIGLDPSLHTSYVTLAVGSAMALLVYPHVLTAAGSAASARSLRRGIAMMPLWTAMLAAFGLLGLAARSAGVVAPAGNAEAALPIFVADLLPALWTGLMFGALAVGALVPAGVMSVAVGALFARNIYAEYLHPEATTVTETRVARITSLVVKAGALLFVVALGSQDAINLQLLGGVWILQTFPAVALGLSTHWLHGQAVLAGWAVGMVLGTYLVAIGGFSALVDVTLFGWSAPVYAALVALAANLSVAAALTPLLDAAGVQRGVDVTALPPLPPKERSR